MGQCPCAWASWFALVLPGARQAKKTTVHRRPCSHSPVPGQCHLRPVGACCWKRGCSSHCFPQAGRRGRLGPNLVIITNLVLE